MSPRPQSIGALLPDWSGRAPMIVSAVLIAAIAAQVVLMLCDSMASATVAGPAVMSADALSASRADARAAEHGMVDIGVISRAALFGRADATLPAGLEVQPTSLAFELVGTLLSSDAQGSRAIVRDSSGGSSRLYAVGEQLPGGAVLQQVDAYRVLLESRGHLESLQIRRGVAASEGALSLLLQVLGVQADSNGAATILASYAPSGDDEREASTQVERVDDRIALVETPIPYRDHDE